MKAVIIHGNPITGFKFVGPFADSAEATAYAEDDIVLQNQPDDWYVADMEEPGIEMEEMAEEEWMELVINGEKS